MSKVIGPQALFGAHYLMSTAPDFEWAEPSGKMKMRKVLRLVRPSNQDTVAALECLLNNAKNGEITGVAVCFRSREGGDEVLFTDAYKAHPEQAISAGLRLSMRLTAAQDALTGAP